VLKGNECEDELKIFIESFFIYIYSVSIIWIVVMFSFIVFAKKRQKIAIKTPTGQKRRLSMPVFAPRTDSRFPEIKVRKQALV
jgi:hypothetical protein